MNNFTDQFWQSPDGLRLHYRDYAGPADRPVVVCLPGLTRNARDFEGLAGRIAGQWRVLCPDMRGRGDSQYAKNSATYNPLQYVQDINALFDELRIERFVVVGTSLGGLMAMLLAMIDAKRLAGAVLNDIGPVIEPSGLARIRDYVGQGRSFPTWMHAARALEEEQSTSFPDYDVHQWLAMAKRVMTVGQNGRIVYDYDMKIAEPFERPGGEAGVDLWPGYMALAGRPLLLLRGELSDLLSTETLGEMARRIPDAVAVSVRRVGHAPTLDEPEAVQAIERLLERVAQQA
ncbi:MULTISPECIES: alpha/beta fold hydrolase [unclassified Novosphingobium]|uniref:alpha/beta fold hydrolase n=1 Tax=unclassified Novosphingobium TaxID=2644732 RepID=UPI00086F01BF|nr:MULTISPECIES: alpha/beta hydrolase [unclassified Novosphingobium]MBN9144745.1 alpha/beta hydrolase [Novosphingobium sp.]MDR6708211.1 pimeloyl-ACP methyl ester carboxylesterase [Novosphingobium sp. 1748]ODU82090.1 MAG: alpha/beta hydrolase [Novosphingobium sp. SCN 63-17]OJX92315.1 MAG: alpha/beta hydrolase [Novosphingobium sp. 63-713]